MDQNSHDSLIKNLDNVQGHRGSLTSFSIYNLSRPATLQRNMDFDNSFLVHLTVRKGSDPKCIQVTSALIYTCKLHLREIYLYTVYITDSL